MISTNPPGSTWFHRLLLLIAVCRPHLLLPAWFGALSGVRWASASAGSMPADRAFGAIAAWSLALAAAHIVNLMTDQSGDELNRKNLFWRGHLAPRTLGIEASVLAAAALLGGARCGQLPPVSASLVLGAAYSLPPLRLGSRPGGGLLCHVAGYAVIAPWLGARLLGSALPFGAVAYLTPLVAAGFWITTVLDRPGDALTGKITCAVRFGRVPILRAALLALAAAAMIGWSQADLAFAFFGGTQRAVAFLLPGVAAGWIGFVLPTEEPQHRPLVIAVVATVLAAGLPGLISFPRLAFVAGVALGISYGVLAAVVRGR